LFFLLTKKNVSRSDFQDKNKTILLVVPFWKREGSYSCDLRYLNQPKKKDRFFDPKKSQKSQVTKPAEKNHHNLAVEMPTQLTGGSAKISRRMNLAILRLSVWELNEQT